MDLAQVNVLRGLLLGSEWLERTDDFAGAMRSATRPGRRRTRSRSSPLVTASRVG